ncbi:MAG: hypothetical protein IKL16_02515 [Clostridia bacterium]|nr:hypothetical protein [Clostridia bacterium]
MTDKELKKLSRLELLELLLTESRENERLRAELEKIKQENTIKKSAQHLNQTSENLGETSDKLSAALQQVSSIISGLDKISVVTVEDKQTPSDETNGAEEIQEEQTDTEVPEIIDEPEAVEEPDEVIGEFESDLLQDEITENQKLNDISKRLDVALQLISSRIKELDRLADIVDADKEGLALYDENKK